MQRDWRARRAADK
jgi:hypothetical protein